jgi:spermidine/putrescine transport system ATP-binding protein
MDEDGYVVAPNGKKYDFAGAKLTLEVPLNKIEFSDDTEFGQLTGTIISSIYHGDHYQVIARTEDEEDFILDTEDTWNVGDVAGIKLNKEDIKIRLKGDYSEYEI